MGFVAFAVVGFFYAGLGKWFWALLAWIVVTSILQRLKLAREQSGQNDDQRKD